MNEQLEKDVSYLSMVQDKLTEELKEKEESLFIAMGKYHELERLHKEEQNKYKKMKK